MFKVYPGVYSMPERTVFSRHHVKELQLLIALREFLSLLCGKDFEVSFYNTENNETNTCLSLAV